MTVGLSLVGFQPSATAVALKTWVREKGRVDRVLLLATARVRQEGQAERLKALCTTWGCQVDILAISDTLDPGQTPPSAPEVVRDELKKLKPETRIAFCADPGPGYMIVAVARTLPRNTIFLHADTAYLHALTLDNGSERHERYPLESLGMEPLLALYDLGARSCPWRVSPDIRALLAALPKIPASVRCGLTFEGRELPSIDLAYERGGWFFGLRRVKNLEQLRETERISLELGGLQPVLTPVVGSSLLQEHAKAARFHAIFPNQKELSGWLNGPIPPPGHAIVPEAPAPPNSLASCTGRGGEGLPLVVWIGTDPSATLVSLCTHRPRHAWILYDAHTPAATEMAKRLRMCSRFLPVTTLEFVGSDLLGRGIVPLLSKQRSRGQALKADISPGRKAQRVALARLPGVQLWSIHTRLGKAVPLVPGPEPLELQGPNLVTQVRMSGGRLARPGDDACAWDPHRRQFLTLLARFLASALTGRSRRLPLDPLRNICCEVGRLSVNGDLVEVEYEGKRKKNTLKPQGGYWFERVVAACFVAAEADEVRVGVRWAWPPESLPPTKHRLAAFRDEVDIVARFGPRFFVASCKVGSQTTLAAAAREIEAVASRLVGRLVVPLVIKPWIDPLQIQKRRTIRQGAAFLDLAALCDPNRARQTLHELWSARSTLGE